MNPLNQSLKSIVQSGKKRIWRMMTLADRVAVLFVTVYSVARVVLLRTRCSKINESARLAL